MELRNRKKVLPVLKKSSRTVKTQILPNKARLPQTKNVEKSKSIEAAKATKTVKFAADFTEDEKCVHVSARSPNTHIKNKRMYNTY